MSNNSKVANPSFPGWLIQAILGILLTCGVAWATWVTKTSNVQDTRITVNEAQLKTVDNSLEEIKESQVRQEAKLDRLIERRP